MGREQGSNTSVKSRPIHARNYSPKRSLTKPIIVAGSGVCYAAAVGYYAPLTQALGGSELHVLERWGLASPRRSVDNLVKRLRQLDAPTTLIGHSQGGLVAALASEVVPDLVERVVTICAPLHGTLLAPPWSPVPSVREMSRAHLSRKTWQPASTMVTVVASEDRFVVPYTSGLRPEAEQHVLTGVGHCAIIWDARLHRLLRDVLARPSRFDQPAA
jgi:pimeloyl-ACP methyl ester carboxylesterase